ncbi:MAG: tRNA (adenosine(37)-N6)-threonylcarbamoyltransferase complex dimerization subunit type 1 TsaB [Sphingobacteriaceae bacterium]|nr:tRNA (adenosine(37)-N6)-threonylcarbamoyltransferase complex dimerization subunit type 1 TsaB [Sphingobacteriaceae bacterium]
MPYILHIETATTVCSVTLSHEHQILSTKEINTGYTHAENLHVFIQEILKETNIQTSQLHAIAISKGPGSYTGLRIGTSSAKGLAFALQIPLIAIDTLKALSVSVLKKTDKETLLCPMLDARRQEVYTAIYDINLKEIISPCAQIVTDENFSFFQMNKPIVFFGDGMVKLQPVLEKIDNASFLKNIVPSAENMVELALSKFKQKEFEDTAYFVPNYMKEFYTTFKK